MVDSKYVACEVTLIGSGVENSVQGGVISHVTYCCMRLKTNL